MLVINTSFNYAKVLTGLSLTRVKYIVIHHAEAVYATPYEIHDWHLAKGYAGFGYNEYVRKDGTVYIGRGDHIGAQCQGYNSISYGICCEGNYDEELTMRKAQFDSLVERIKYNMKRFPNKIEVVPHKKLCATDCPGKNFPLQKILSTIMVMPAPKPALPTIQLNSTGESVKYMQSQLNKLGFGCGVADGIFGKMTETALKKFQASKGLVADGICGIKTWGYLR